ncbi:MAG: PTS sugar transporter subunit IIA [Gemmatimonadales bacterium]
MPLKDYFQNHSIALGLEATTRDEAIREMVGLLGLDEAGTQTLVKLARRREGLGSTGVGRGIAIPHCRSPLVNQIRLAFGRTVKGIDYQSVDGAPVRFLFLIVAPPELASQYLAVLGKIAQFAKDDDTPGRLAEVNTPEELLELMEKKGV